MDLGIAGKSAIVGAASKGLGRGCAEALAAEGVNLIIAARTRADIEDTALDIEHQYKVEVIPIAADVTSEAGRALILEACPDPDILVTNAGGPPPGDFRDWSRDDWIKALDANMLAHIDMIQATIDGMITRKFGRIVNITSSAVKAPMAHLGLSNGARSGLTGFVAGLARQVIAHGVTINNILPGPFDTDRLRKTTKAMAEAQGKDFEAVWEDRLQSHPAGRFGTADEFGKACAYLCSRHAGYITGQNLLLDGGLYPGVF